MPPGLAGRTCLFGATHRGVRGQASLLREVRQSTWRTRRTKFVCDPNRRVESRPLGDYYAVYLGEDPLLALIRLDGRDYGVTGYVDDVGVLVEHHQRLSTAALAEGVHGLAQAVHLVPLHRYLTLLDTLQGMLRELERVFIGGG